MAKSTGPITVKVELPDLTKKLLGAVKAVMKLPKEWTNEATITVGELATAVGKALLPDGEHNEEVCSTGIAVCEECVTAQ